MSKKKPALKNPDYYEYITATVMDGMLAFRYKLNGRPPSNMSHDEDVSEWSDGDIKNCIRNLLNVDPSDPVKIDIDFQ